MRYYELIEGNGLFNLLKNPKFKKWFGSSKIVDRNGLPLICYHGTNVEFNVFDIEKSGSRTDHEFFGRGIYLTPCTKDANYYATYSRGIGTDFQGHIMPLVVRCVNPFITDQGGISEQEYKQIRKDGYDCIIKTDYLPERYKNLYPVDIREIVVFDSKDIKSVFAREFSDSSDIREGRKIVIPHAFLYGDLECWEINTQRDLLGLLNKFSVVRAMLQGDTLYGWNAEDFAHMDFVKHFGSGVSFMVYRSGDTYETEISIPANIGIEGLKSNKTFQRVFKGFPIDFDN